MIAVWESTNVMGSEFRVGFCVSGQGRLFRSAVMQSQELGMRPALVVADHSASTELEAFCESSKVPFVRLEKLRRAEFNAEITRICVDAKLDLLCLTFDRIIPPELVRHYRGRIINVHMGLLPAFKGMRAVEQALSANALYAGATVHEVDEELDNGPIIAQCVLGLRRNDTPRSVGGRLFGMLRLMYLQVIAWYVEDRVFRDEQGHTRIRGAVYGELPISPAIERGFPD